MQNTVYIERFPIEYQQYDLTRPARSINSLPCQDRRFRRNGLPSLPKQRVFANPQADMPILPIGGDGSAIPSEFCGYAGLVALVHAFGEAPGGEVA
jgi:hypothetical protein